MARGLQYKGLRQGNGPVSKLHDSVVVGYRGTLVDGEEFDSTKRLGGPATILVKGVLKGWTEALQLMKTGSTWHLFIPSELAYGKRQFGRIPPNAVLIFEMELLSISKEAAPLILETSGDGGDNASESKPGD